jgi:hypothetical protein
MAKTEPEMATCSRCPRVFPVPPKAKSVPGLCLECHTEMLAEFWALMEEDK